MLNDSRVEANIPASDLTRARAFYADKLGLTPSSERMGTLTFKTASGTAFNVYETQHAGMAGHTIAQWHVDDIDAEVSALKDKGIAFEVYDLPGVDWSGEIASIPGLGARSLVQGQRGQHHVPGPGGAELVQCFAVDRAWPFTTC